MALVNNKQGASKPGISPSPTGFLKKKSKLKEGENIPNIINKN
jgi:hypothetical protein